MKDQRSDLPEALAASTWLSDAPVQNIAFRRQREIIPGGQWRTMLALLRPFFPACVTDVPPGRMAGPRGPRPVLASCLCLKNTFLGCGSRRKINAYCSQGRCNASHNTRLTAYSPMIHSQELGVSEITGGKKISASSSPPVCNRVCPFFASRHLFAHLPKQAFRALRRHCRRRYDCCRNISAMRSKRVSALFS